VFHVFSSILFLYYFLFMFLFVLYLWGGHTVAQSVRCSPLTADKRPLCVRFAVDKLALEICCQYLGIFLSVSINQCCFICYPNIIPLANGSIFKHHTSVHFLFIFLSSSAFCIGSSVFFRPFPFGSYFPLLSSFSFVFICFVSISSY
jgi:hypothetical protein